MPLHDFFSYCKRRHLVHPWEWLADILLAGVYGMGGLRAVALGAILLISATFTLLYFMARKSNALVAIVVTMAGAAASSGALAGTAAPVYAVLPGVVLYDARRYAPRVAVGVVASAGGHRSFGRICTAAFSWGSP